MENAILEQADADEPASPAKRRSRRLKTFRPANLQAGGTTHRIHLLDVSASGALGHGAAPRKGSWVTLSLGGLQRSAVIAWSSGQRFGLAFIQPLSEPELAELLA